MIPTSSSDLIFVVMTGLTFLASAAAGLAFRNLTAGGLAFFFGGSAAWCALALAAGPAGWTAEDAARCAAFQSAAAVLAALGAARRLAAAERWRARCGVLAAVLGFGALGLAGAAWPEALRWAYRGRLPLEAAVVVALAVVLAAARRSGGPSLAELAGLRALLIPNVLHLAALAAWEVAPTLAAWLGQAGGLAYVVLALAAAQQARRAGRA